MKFLERLSDRYINKVPENVNSEDANKPFVVHLVSVIILFACLIFGIISALNQHMIQAITLFATSLGSLGAYYTNRRLKNFWLSRIIITLFSVVILLVAFITGGQTGTGYLWSYVFPVGAILLYGNRKGGMLSIGYFLVLVALILLQNNLNLDITYGLAFSLRFLGFLLNLL